VAYLSALPPSSRSRRRHAEKQRELLEGLDRATLKVLRQHLERFPELQDAARDLSSLISLRDELIHHWWKQPRTAKMQSPEGRDELVIELGEVVDRLGTTTAAISANAVVIAFRR
jgi:hypothetical protein